MLQVESYAHLPHVYPLRAAVSNRTGTATLRSASESSRVLDGGAAAARGRTEQAPMLSLAQLWEQAVRPRGWARIDALVVDAESHEHQILGFDNVLPTPVPGLILFEFCWLKELWQEAIHANLARQGYTWLADLTHPNSGPTDRLYGHAKRHAGAAGGRRRPYFYYPGRRECDSLKASAQMAHLEEDPCMHTPVHLLMCMACAWHGQASAQMAHLEEDCRAWLRGVAPLGRAVEAV